MKASSIIRIIYSSVFAFICSGLLLAQEAVVSLPQRDSLVSVNDEGDRIVSYTYHTLPAEISNTERARHTKRQYISSESMLEQHLEVIDSGRLTLLSSNVTPDLSDYSVGSIPIQGSVSPFGGRIYSILISLPEEEKLSPALSLVYNSQSGNDIAGYGWGLAGLSSIEIRKSINPNRWDNYHHIKWYQHK